MLEMPELFERHMTLGKKALEEMEYEEACDHFESAYELEDDVQANFYLTKSLVYLKRFPYAYEILSEKKRIYQTEPEFQSLYFDVLLQLNYFFEIEKQLELVDGELKKDCQKAYEIAKEYQWMLRSEELKQIENELYQMGEYSSRRQGLILKKLKYLPREQVVSLAKVLLVDERVSLFTRSELVNQLAQINLGETLSILTWQGAVKEFIPQEITSLLVVYQTSAILKGVREYFSQRAPSVQKEVEQSVKLHLGCFYPFQNEEMRQTDTWVASYVAKYQGELLKNVDQEQLESILVKQDKLDEEVFKLLSFD